jgi:hypothetical protein
MSSKHSTWCWHCLSQATVNETCHVLDVMVVHELTRICLRIVKGSTSTDLGLDYQAGWRWRWHQAISLGRRPLVQCRHAGCSNMSCSMQWYTVDANWGGVVLFCTALRFLVGGMVSLPLLFYMK